MTLMDTHQHTTLTAMRQRVNYIIASISVFNEKILWIYLDLFFLDFHFFNHHGNIIIEPWPHNGELFPCLAS